MKNKLMPAIQVRMEKRKSDTSVGLPNAFPFSSVTASVITRITGVMSFSMYKRIRYKRWYRSL